MFMDREKVISHLSDPDLRKEMLRLLDLWERSFRRRSVELTDFFDPYYLKTGLGILQGLKGLSFAVNGGYQGAERVRVAMFPSEVAIEDVDFSISFLEVTGNFKFQKVTHRDYLGSLLGIGLTREKIGDLLVQSSGCQVILDREIIDYVLMQWTRVNHVSVRAKVISGSQLVIPEQEKKSIRGTVASPRLDAVLGIGFGLSRTKTLPEIKSGRVRVNWQTVTDPAFLLEAGDRISCQGKGRINVVSFSGPTAKGRLFVQIEKFR